MTRRLPDYYRAAVVPESLRDRQCGLCRTPVDERYDLCFRCNQQPFARPDLAGFVTYAVKGQQSGAEMYRYKNRPPSPQAVEHVLLLLEHGLSHLRCAGRLVEAPVGAVAVVPSRTHYQPGAPSPLQRLCARALPESVPVVDLRPTAGSVSDRQTRGDAFKVAGCADWSHVMLVDDTWVSGATVFSATTSLRRAGVRWVSTLVLARWLDRDYGPTQDLLTQGTQIPGWPRPQDVCPFTTDGTCPGPTVKE